jgi:hypothetical protein
MCFRDLIEELRRRDVCVTESQIRWGIRTGKLARPPLDGSLRFNFSVEHADEIETHFGRLDTTQA